MKTGWNEKGGGKEYKDGQWSAKEPEKKKPSKYDSSSDLTPSAVAKINDDLKVRCKALQDSVDGFFKKTFGKYAPNAIKFELALKVSGQKGEIGPSKEDEAKAPPGQAKGKAAPQIGAAIEGAAQIGWGGEEEFKKWSFATTLMGEKVSGEAILGGALFAGIQAKVSGEVSLASEALSFAERVLTGWEGLAKSSASVAESEVKKDEGKVDTSKGVPKLQGGQTKERAATSLGVKVAGEVFGGLKIGPSLKANLKWTKKSGAQYAQQVAAFVKAGKHVPPQMMELLSFLLEASSGVADVLLGDAGDVDLASAACSLTVGLGAGASGKLEASWSTTRGFTFVAEGSAYWGLGAGLATEIAINPVDAVRLAVVVAAKAGGWLDELAAKAGGAVSDFFKAFAGRVGEFMDWLDADDKVRDAVHLDLHEVMTAQQRAGMIATLLDPACFDDSEQAIIDVLDFSAKKGDLPSVLKLVDVPTLLSKVNGAEHSMVAAFLDKDKKAPSYVVRYGVFGRGTTEATVEDGQLWVRSTSMKDFDAYAVETTKADWTGGNDYWFTIVAPTQATSAFMESNQVVARYPSHEAARSELAKARIPGRIGDK